jgi:iron complex outermembrane receptor protein
MKAYNVRGRTRTSILSGAGVGALAVAMLAGPALAQAQSSAQSQPAAVDEIVVTGVRASVGSALQLKKTATQLQESIVAEDIGKLPDNNVVESLQHVTGISIIRNGVEPGTVLIRGLPDIATTLNGRSIFTSSSRSISLPDLPAELLARVDVKKSPSADDLEGGIAGLIDVTLHRPFDFNAPQLAIGVKDTYGSLSKKYGPQGSILASDRWDTGIGEIGFLVNLSYRDQEAMTEQVNANQRTVKRSGVTGAGDGPATGLTAGQVAVPNIARMYQTPTSNKRTAVNASAQWRPSDSVDFYADYFYSGLRNQASTDVVVILEATCPNNAGTVPFSGTNVGQVLPGGCYALSSMQDRRSKEDTHQFALGGNWYVNDRMTVKGQGSYTKSADNTRSIIPDAQFNFASPTSGVTVTVNPRNNGGINFDMPGDPQLSANHYLDQWYDGRSPRKGHEYAGRIDVNYKMADDFFITSIDAGYRYNDREAIADNENTGLSCADTAGDGSNAYNKYKLFVLNSQACTAYRAQTTATRAGGISYADIGAASFHRTKGSFFDGKMGTTAWNDMDPDWLWDNIEKMRNLFGYSGQLDLIPTQHFDVSEKSNAGYLKGNYAATFPNGMTLDGNIGVRVIKTQLTEAGFSSTYVPIDPNLRANQGVNSTCTTCLVYKPVSSTRSDTQVLPSFNARLKLTDELFLRGGASKTVTRPTFAQLNPGTTVSAANTVLLGTASSGNPGLTPVKSTNYDLDLTQYWGHANHIGASVFYRQVSGYIQSTQSTLVIEGLNYILSRPENKQNASIKGIEAGYSQFLDFLPGLWSGFGWDVNATYIKAPFNNVPKFHANLAGIYEKGPYSVRLSYTYNQPYRVGDLASGAQPQSTYASVRENMDFSFNYRLNERWSASFDATNLLDSYQREHAGPGDQNELLYPTQLARFDKTYSIGLRYKM